MLIDDNEALQYQSAARSLPFVKSLILVRRVPFFPDAVKGGEDSIGMTTTFGRSRDEGRFNLRPTCVDWVLACQRALFITLQ